MLCLEIWKFPESTNLETYYYRFMDNNNIIWFIKKKKLVFMFDISIFNYLRVEIYQFYDCINSILSGVVVRAPPSLEGLQYMPAMCIGNTRPPSLCRF